MYLSASPTTHDARAGPIVISGFAQLSGLHYSSSNSVGQGLRDKKRGCAAAAKVDNFIVGAIA